MTLPDIFSAITTASTVILFLCFGWIAAMFAVAEALRRTKARRAIAEFRRQRRYHRAELDSEREAHATEVAVLRDQLRDQSDGPKPFDAIAACRFERTPLMNGSERRLFALVADALDGSEYKVWPQVPLGEVLFVSRSKGSEPERRRASQEIQCKRVDMAVTDGKGRIVMAIEYQGAGHYQGTAAWRDQIKRAVFAAARVELVEVLSGDTPSAVRAKLHSLLGEPRSLAPSPRAGSPSPVSGAVGWNTVIPSNGSGA